MSTANYTLARVDDQPANLGLKISRFGDRFVTIDTGINLTNTVLQWVAKATETAPDSAELLNFDNQAAGHLTVLNNDAGVPTIVGLVFAHGALGNKSKFPDNRPASMVQGCKAWSADGNEINLWEGSFAVTNFVIEATEAPTPLVVTPPTPVPVAFGAYRPRQSPFTTPQHDTALVYFNDVAQHPALVHRFQDLVHPLEPSAPTDWFAPAWADEVLTNGLHDGGGNPVALPVISWELNDYTLGAVQPAYNNASFLAGNHDAAMLAFLTQAAAWNKPFILVPFWEMTGKYYSWAAQINGNSAASFIAAWRYVYTFIKAHTPKAFVPWTPSVDIPKAGLLPLSSCWPGDAYVDGAGMDGYNKGSTSTDQNGQYWSFQTVFQATYAEITALTQKPILIKETGADPTGGDKAAWMAAIPGALPLWPNVRGVCWFSNINGAQNYKFDDTPTNLAAYRALAANSYMQGSFPTG